jgi:hypothetical protein
VKKTIWFRPRVALIVEFVATSPEDLQFMMRAFDEISMAFGQQVSVKKTKVMTVHKRLLPGEQFIEDIPLSITSQGQVLENVDVFPYVGGKENIRGDMVDEVTVRLSRMSAAFASLSDRVFLNPNIHLFTKLRFLILLLLVMVCMAVRHGILRVDKFSRLIRGNFVIEKDFKI